MHVDHTYYNRNFNLKASNMSTLIQKRGSLIQFLYLVPIYELGDLLLDDNVELVVMETMACGY